MVLTPWNNPLSLTRGWCIWELYCTIDTESKLGIAMTASSKKGLINEVDQHIISTWRDMFRTIDCERSQCANLLDEQQIHEVIRTTVGFLTLNAKLFRALSQWILDNFKEERMIDSAVEGSDRAEHEISPTRLPEVQIFFANPNENVPKSAYDFIYRQVIMDKMLDEYEFPSLNATESAETNLNELRASAEAGDVVAMNELADYYRFRGNNMNEAIKYYRLAIDGGNTEAMNSLGVCYSDGNGVEKDLSESVKYFRMSADGGFIDAMYNLADCYHHGEGVEVDLNEAVKYYRMAAAAGNLDAISMLESCNENGLGVEKDLNPEDKLEIK